MKIKKIKRIKKSPRVNKGIKQCPQCGMDMLMVKIETGKLTHPFRKRWECIDKRSCKHTEISEGLYELKIINGLTDRDIGILKLNIIQ